MPWQATDLTISPASAAKLGVRTDKLARDVRREPIADE